MATQPKKAHDDDEEITDVAGRKHDSKGRFLPEDEDDKADRKDGPDDRPKANGKPPAGGKAGQTPAAQKKVLNRAIRVLNEIESRIHELREELEEQTGEHAPAGKPGPRLRKDDDQDDDERGDDHRANGQGRVKHPESDRRLKQNKDD